ncbi:hypothetical protein GGR73_003072 [Xanthomonas sp. F14]
MFSVMIALCRVWDSKREPDSITKFLAAHASTQK